jgi:hypothetical protein
MNTQSPVKVMQVCQAGTSKQLWQQLKEGYREGKAVELEGRSWSVAGFRRIRNEELRTLVATIKLS